MVVGRKLKSSAALTCLAAVGSGTTPHVVAQASVRRVLFLVILLHDLIEVTPGLGHLRVVMEECIDLRSCRPKAA